MRQIDSFDLKYDRFMVPLEAMGFRRWRAEVVARALPPILEIGIGTGASLSIYRDTLSGPVVGLDREGSMIGRAQQRARALDCQVLLSQMDALNLAFPDGIFNSVVTSLVLCSLPDPKQGLAQMRRVLRPGGRLYMMEHVRPQHPLLGRAADWLNLAWTLFSQGCQLNRRTLDTLVESGFELESDESHFGGVVQLVVAGTGGDSS